MNDTERFRNDKVFTILTWGTAAFLLMVGFAMERHGLFELWPVKVPAAVTEAEQELLTLCETTPTLEALQTRLAIARAKATETDEAEDAKLRSYGLLVCAVAWLYLFPRAIRLPYKNLSPENQIIPRGKATAYGVALGLANLIIAILVCWK